MSNGYVEPVTEIPKLLREFIKKKYPNYKFSVTRINYNSINVDLFEADFDAFVTDIKNTPINPFYIQNDTNLTADAKKVMQDIYDFLSPNEYKNSGAYNFYLTMNVGRNAIPYKNVGKKSYSTKGSYNSSTSNAVYDKGTLIRTCGGWELYRATTKTNKVVYNAIKLPNTPLNKTDWDVIKGEITTETGFKYQYGAFTKWGIIDDARIDKLCELFEKYYTNQSNQNTTNTKPTTPQINKIEPINQVERIEIISIFDKDSKYLGGYNTFKEFNKNVPIYGSEYYIYFTFTNGFVKYFNEKFWKYNSIEKYIEWIYNSFFGDPKIAFSNNIYELVEKTTTSAQTTTPKILTKADFERRIKGVELLLKNTNDTLEIIKYNKKLKGLRLLLKNS